jgi:hypothetical protein
MKYSIRLIYIFHLLFISSSLFAQNTSTTSLKDSLPSKIAEPQQMKTLFSDSKIVHLKSWGLSMSPFVQFGQIGQQRGFNFAFHANNKWSIGIAHIQSINTHQNPNAKGELDKPATAFTALSLEYTVKSNSIWHVSFPFMIGSVVAREQNIMIPAYKLSQYNPIMHKHMQNQNDFRGPKSFGFQAGINLELNVYKYVKLFTGVNYRFVAGENSTREMDGLSGTVGLKLGLFDQKINKIKN